MNFLPFDGAKLCDFRRNNIMLCYIYFADCYTKDFCPDKGFARTKKRVISELLLLMHSLTYG